LRRKAKIADGLFALLDPHAAEFPAEPSVEALQRAPGALDDLACAWKDLSARGIKPASWAITEQIVAAGIAGIVVPSFAKGAVAADINAVFWGWAPNPPTWCG
jgi:RES domain-containing protein